MGTNRYTLFSDGQSQSLSQKLMDLAQLAEKEKHYSQIVPELKSLGNDTLMQSIKNDVKKQFGGDFNLLNILVIELGLENNEAIQNLLGAHNDLEPKKIQPKFSAP